MRSYLKGILILVLLTFVYVNTEVYKLQGSQGKGGSKSDNHSDNKTDNNSTRVDGDHNSTHTNGDHNSTNTQENRT